MIKHVSVLTFSLSIGGYSDRFSWWGRESRGVWRCRNIAPTLALSVDPQHARKCSYLLGFVVMSTERLRTITLDQVIQTHLKKIMVSALAYRLCQKG